MNKNARTATNTKNCPSSVGARPSPIAVKNASKEIEDFISETANLPKNNK